MATNEGLDVVLDQIGFGLWQIPVILLTTFAILVVPMHAMGSPLMSAPVAFRCISASNTSLLSLPPTFDSQSTTESFYDNKCLDPGEHILPNGTESFEGTSHYTGLPSCPWVLYDHSTFSSTIISQWNLICEREVMRPLFQMMYSIGAFIGGFIGGQISDSFGRKRAVIIGAGINMIAVIFLYFSQHYTTALLIRAVLGGSCNFMFLPAYGLALEITPTKYRTAAGMLLGLPCSVGLVLIAGTGYLIRDWRNLMILNAATPFIFIIPLLFWAKESPRWLIQHGRASEAKVMMTSAAKMNKVTLSNHLAKAIEDLGNDSTVNPSDDEKGSRGGLCTSCKVEPSCIQSKAMRMILILSPIVWSFQGMLYLGVVLNANNFSSNDPFIYIAMTGVMDATSILVATPLGMRIGRRVIIGGGLLVSGILFMADMAVPVELHWFKFGLVMTALTLVAASFQINYLYSPELYPTVLRTRGLAVSNFAYNIGFVVAPLIVDLLAPLAWWSVSVTFGCGGILGSLLVPFLPETLNEPLPETVADVDKRQRNANLCFWKSKSNKDYQVSDIKPEENEILTS